MSEVGKSFSFLLLFFFLFLVFFCSVFVGACCHERKCINAIEES